MKYSGCIRGLDLEISPSPKFLAVCIISKDSTEAQWKLPGMVRRGCCICEYIFRVTWYSFEVGFGLSVRLWCIGWTRISLRKTRRSFKVSRDKYNSIKSSKYLFSSLSPRNQKKPRKTSKQTAQNPDLFFSKIQKFLPSITSPPPIQTFSLSQLEKRSSHCQNNGRTVCTLISQAAAPSPQPVVYLYTQRRERS